jgi:potassium-transporting ATPase potassium-binding subunit
MNAQAWFLMAAFLGVLLLLAWPLGKWLVAVADGQLPRWMAPFVAVERGLYRLAGSMRPPAWAGASTPSR